MKKRQMMVLLVLMSVMSACADGNAAERSNTIAEAELTSREGYMLTATADRSFVYDFNLGNESKEASIWIDKYEFGELVEPALSRMWTEVEGSGFILFSISDTHVNPHEKRIDMGVFGKSGGGSGTSIDEITALDSSTEMSTWQSVVTDAVDITEGDIILASLSISMDSDNMQSLSPDFFEDIQGNLEEIEDYAAVYIFKAEFNESNADE